MKSSDCKNGFTLAEVLIAVIFVGLAIAALMAGNGAFTQANAAANEISTAEFLTEQIRERTKLVAFGSLHSFDDGSPYTPPIDAGGESLGDDFAAYSQHVTVEYVDNTNFTQVDATPDSNNRFIRVTVKIDRGTKEVSSASWIRALY